MNVEIGAEAALFPEKEYLSGICVAVQLVLYCTSFIFKYSSYNIVYTLEENVS